MENLNYTRVTDFIFLGFPSLRRFQVMLFIVFLMIYILTITSNIVIIALVRGDRHLHTPMYIVISSFSFLEILYTSATVPKMLSVLLAEMKSISFEECMTQLYVFFSLGSTECFSLALMAFDRYLAICNPLRYSTIMTNRVCLQLIVGCWACGFLASVLTITFVATLPFCGPNKINHFFCDYPPLLLLSCGDSHTTEVVFFTLSWSVVLTTFTLTLASYMYIILTILRIPSSKGRSKAFSTCASHLTVVTMFYGTVIFMYVRPKASYNFDTDKVVSVFYSVNPVIYCLRNKEVKQALRKAVGHITNMI